MKINPKNPVSANWESLWAAKHYEKAGATTFACRSN